MKSDWRNNRDFLAGLLYIVVGVIAMFIARDYPFGSALRMGPGYFPTVLGGMMVVFGIAVMLMGVKNNEKIKGSWSIRALIVLPIATAVFGYTMEHGGFLPALALLIVVSAAAGTQFKWKEIIPMMLVLCLISWAIFIWGLGLPYPMIKGLWEF